MNTFAPALDAHLETKVNEVVERVVALRNLGSTTGVDTTFAQKKALLSIPQALRVHAFNRIVNAEAAKVAAEAQYGVARNVLSGS